jgi:hypothetical protein
MIGGIEVMTEPIRQSPAPSFAALQQESVPKQPLAVRRAAIRTAALGVAFSVLYLLTFLIVGWRVPPVGATDEEVIAFYSDPADRRILIAVGLYLVPFTGIAFIWFIVALRMWVTASAPRENVLFSNVQLVSGIIFTALLFVAGASMSVTAATVEFSNGPIDPLLARQFPQYGSMILLVFAMRMAAMFVLATSSIGRTTGILPNWFAYLSFAMALGLLLSLSLSSWLVIAFPAWILACCAILLDRARKIPRDLVVPGPAQATERLSSGPAIH